MKPFAKCLRRLTSVFPLAALLASTPVGGAEMLHDNSGPTLGGFVGTRFSFAFGGRVESPARFGIVGTTTFNDLHSSHRTQGIPIPAFEFDLLRSSDSAFRIGGIPVGVAKSQLLDGKTALMGGSVIGLAAVAIILSSGSDRARCDSPSTPQDAPCFD